MEVFKNFKQVVKIREVLLDNEVFQLHYRVTALLLLGCAALVASKQHFGDPIDCITRDDVPNKIMDTYCWIHATFTLPSACNKTVGTEVPHPCVDKSLGENEDRVYHKYYQWVYFVLFFQAACFYAPHFFWKHVESKRLAKLTNELRDPLFQLSNDKKEEVGLIVNYIIRNRSRHQSYFHYFVLFEVVNFLNVIAQIYLVDEFLGGTFTTYGLDVINYAQLDQDYRVDPMVRIFPRMTKCSFRRFGASGDLQKYDALCILPLNIINEKIYIIMWFWFVFLAIVTALWLIYRLSTIVNPHVRHRVLRKRASLVYDVKLSYILHRLQDAGDWFLLSMMCKNMDAQWFRFLANILYNDLKELEEREREASLKRDPGFRKRSSAGSRRPANEGSRKTANGGSGNSNKPLIAPPQGGDDGYEGPGGSPDTSSESSTDENFEVDKVTVVT